MSKQNWWLPGTGREAKTSINLGLIDAGDINAFSDIKAEKKQEICNVTKREYAYFVYT